MFEISEEQNKKITAWSEEQNKKWLAARAEQAKTSETPMGLSPYGAIGGELIYSFTPTSIGVVVKVRHASGEELDVTDYENW